MVDANTLIEGHCKFRDGKKWKTRWAVVTKLSPVADCLQLQIYRDEKERARNGHTKASLSLQQFLAMESGFTLDKESHTLALICQDLSVVLAFDNRERLIQWSVRIVNNLGEGHSFLVQLASAPTKSKLTPGPVKLHVTDKRFCLTGGIPPKLLGAWEITQLRRYGIVEGRLIFEGGSRCGKGEGVHVLIPDAPQLGLIMDALDSSAKGLLSRTLNHNNQQGRKHGGREGIDSPRKSAVSRLTENHNNVSHQISANPNYISTLSPVSQPRESRSAEELCCNSCHLPPIQQMNIQEPDDPPHVEPMASGMERCLSCMSKLGQHGHHHHHDVLSPSWTMDLNHVTGVSPSCLPHTKVGNVNSKNGGSCGSNSDRADRLSISSHGSSSGNNLYYEGNSYENPRNNATANVMGMNKGRSSTPPNGHNRSLSYATSLMQHQSSPLQQCRNSNRANLSSNEKNGKCGPFENYDVPRSGPAILAGFQQTPSEINWSKKGPMDRSSIASSHHTTNSDPLSISLSEYYETPRRFNSSQHSSSNFHQGNFQQQQRQHHNHQQGTMSPQAQFLKSRNSQLELNDHCYSIPRDPMENYDVPPPPACSQCVQQPQASHYSTPPPSTCNPMSQSGHSGHSGQSGYSGQTRINGEGKMPVVNMDTGLNIPSVPIYAIVDKSKKTKSSLNVNNCEHVYYNESMPNYMNLNYETESRTVEKSNGKKKEPLATPPPPNRPPKKKDDGHGNYVNMGFAGSLDLYENSRDVINNSQNHMRQNSPSQNPASQNSGQNHTSLNPGQNHMSQNLMNPAIIQDSSVSQISSGSQNVPIQKVLIEKNLEPNIEKLEAKEAEEEVFTNPLIGKEKKMNTLPLRRSSSVPCKGGNWNRRSSSSSDSGVSDGGIFESHSSSPTVLHEFTSHCLHESLPRKTVRHHSNSPPAPAPFDSQNKSTKEDKGEMIRKGFEVRHYETLEEASTVILPKRSENEREINDKEMCRDRGVRNPFLANCGDGLSTSSGGSFDNSDPYFMDSSSSVSSNAHLYVDVNVVGAARSGSSNASTNQSEPLKGGNLVKKPRSGTEYFKIDRTKLQ